MWLALRSVRLRRGSAEPCPGLVGIPCLYNADEGQRFPEGPCAAGGADHGEADAQRSPGPSPQYTARPPEIAKTQILAVAKNKGADRAQCSCKRASTAAGGPSGRSPGMMIPTSRRDTRLLRCDISNRLWTASGQTTTSPSRLLCQLRPAADIRSHRLSLVPLRMRST